MQHSSTADPVFALRSVPRLNESVTEPCVLDLVLHTFGSIEFSLVFVCGQSVSEFLWDILPASIQFPVMPKRAQYARFGQENGKLTGATACCISESTVAFRCPSGDPRCPSGCWSFAARCALRLGPTGGSQRGCRQALSRSRRLLKGERCRDGGQKKHRKSK